MTTSATQDDASLLQHYAPSPTDHDELLTGNRRFREHWLHVGPALEALGMDELAQRQQDVDRLLEADGASYRILDSGRPQRWQLDPIPHVLPSSEWAELESGVIQRAELLDLVLRDLYGDGSLLKRGLLPPELVFDHPGFLPACQGVGLPDGSQLFTYAVDLGRTSEGEFRVISDHAQAPSGAGYALEDRVVLSRVFPSLYRDAQVHRVAPYFRSLRAGLQALGSHRSDDPRIVVLTPGSMSETAFEHAYLASYLGYSLVEGSDLVVQNGSVFVRSLGQLEPVDVILRRVDASFCDPLELRPESRLGVPGLLEACRRGNVAVANTLGSGAIENPALNAFLPAISKALLGQDLLLSSPTTWWCGDPSSLSYVIDHLDQLVCKPVARNHTSRVQFPMQMIGSEREDLRLRILAEPHRWVAQEKINLSTTPTLTPQGVQPRRSTLRTYAVAREGSYAVMPGGLTRVAPDDSSPLISNQLGALAKDTWVLASEPDQPSELWLRRSGSPRTRSDAFPGLSERAAENLFWMGRHSERAESAVRLLRAVHDGRNTQTTNDKGDWGTTLALLEALRVTTFSAFDFHGSDRERLMEQADTELFSLTSDQNRVGSLAHSVVKVLENADTLRDQLSVDTWQITNTLEKELEVLATIAPGRQDVVQGTLGSVMQSLLALQGLSAESMVRDPGWHFMEAGRRIERFQNVALLLGSLLGTERSVAVDSLVLESTLVATESIITYRRRYRSQAQVETILALLVTDEGNPRSLRFQIDRLQDALAGLPGSATGGLTTEERGVIEVLTAIRVADCELLAATDANGNRTELHRFLQDLVRQLNEVAASMAQRSFSQLAPQRSLGSTNDEES